MEKPEPAIKGQKLYDLLSYLIIALTDLGNGLYTATDSKGRGIPAVTTSGDNLITDALELSAKLEKIRSEKTFLL